MVPEENRKFDIVRLLSLFVANASEIELLIEIIDSDSKLAIK